MANVSSYLEQKIPRDIRVADTQQIGIGAFTALVRVTETVNFESSAPTTILEDGSSVNDHIINQPITLQITGEVSDIQALPTQADLIINNVNANLGTITKYLPANTSFQISKINTIVNEARDIVNRLDDVINDSQQIYNLFGNKSLGKKNTQKFFDSMEKIRRAKLPIKIQMPYKVYEKMAIVSITINTDNQAEPLSFSINAQEIRFAKVDFVGIEEFKENPSTALKGQTDGATNKGVNEGTEINDNQSVANAGWNFLKGFFP